MNVCCNLGCVSKRTRGHLNWKDTLCERRIGIVWLYRALWAVHCCSATSVLRPARLETQPSPLPGGYTIEVEEVVSHIEGKLAGLTTFRLYLNCLHADDYVSSCSGDNDSPLIIASTASPSLVQLCIQRGLECPRHQSGFARRVARIGVRQLHHHWC